MTILGYTLCHKKAQKALLIFEPFVLLVAKMRA
jgi:hypothetical protein